LPNDKKSIHRICRAFDKVEQDAIDSVLEQYFVHNSDGYINKKALDVMAKDLPRIEAAKINGRKGGRPPEKPSGNPVGYENKPIGNPDETHAQSYPQPQPQPQLKPQPEPTPQPKEKAKTNTPRKRDELFDRFYASYPKKKNKGTAEKAWKKLSFKNGLFDKIMKAVESAKQSPEWQKDNGTFIPYPASWLNAKGWLDESTIIKSDGLSPAGRRTKAAAERVFGGVG